ncbi:PaaI family thioesterase [Sneathiella marina]|uniref:PaaI family thioesterase n=1 Tax=Sneathiella marina TaxID=2950108 RepID=A0ABY4W6D7_9PROT|nr:PaaI family thioesterase [Sneathiella marina]USG60221.1 PaaI family thioesterase [Sneathiella marina]
MTIAQAQNPEFDKVVVDSFSRQPFMHTIGATLSTLEPGICEVSVDRDESLTQQHGFFHGGLVAAVADSAAGYAAFSLFPVDSTVLTVDYNVKFLRPANGSTIRACAEVVKPGRTLYVVKADVFVKDAGAERHCLTGLFTMMCLMGKPDAQNLGREPHKMSTEMT